MAIRLTGVTAASLSVALWLSACSTPYQGMGLTGGVAAQHIDAETVMINARGNGFTDPSAIRMYVIRKAAEETLASGYDWFSIEESQDRTRHGSYATAGSYTSSTNVSAYGLGNTAYGSATTQSTYMPGQVMHYRKPGMETVIRLHRGPKPEGINGYIAAGVLRYAAPPKPVGS